MPGQVYNTCVLKVPWLQHAELFFMWRCGQPGGRFQCAWPSRFDKCDRNVI